MIQAADIAASASFLRCRCSLLKVRPRRRPLFALLEHERKDRQRQGDNRDYIAEHFEGLQEVHPASKSTPSAENQPKLTAHP